MHYDKANLIRDAMMTDESKALDEATMGFIFDQAILFKKHKFINLLLDMDFDIARYITPLKLVQYYRAF